MTESAVKLFTAGLLILPWIPACAGMTKNQNLSTDWGFSSPSTRFPKTGHSGARRNPDERFLDLTFNFAPFAKHRIARCFIPAFVNADKSRNGA